jgi:excisionase family DNA binding protein
LENIIMESTSTPARRRGRPRKFPLPTVPTVNPIVDVEALANAVVRESKADINDLGSLEQAITAKLRAIVDKELARQPVIQVLLLTLPQVAQALQVSEGTISNMLAAGQLSSVSIRGSRRVALDEVRRLAQVGTN